MKNDTTIPPLDLYSFLGASFMSHDFSSVGEGPVVIGLEMFAFFLKEKNLLKEDYNDTYSQMTRKQQVLGA